MSKWFYALEVPARTHVFIGLHQEDERQQGILPRRPYLDAGLTLMKRDPETGITSLVINKPMEQSRNVDLETVLEEGHYIVIPRTTGCNLRRPTDAENENIVLVQNGKMTELFESTVDDIFRKFDLVINHSIDFKEFSGFFEIIGKKITDLQFKSDILGEFNSHPDKGLTMRGFRDWWLNQHETLGPEVVWSWLDKLGYDRDLYSYRSRLFNLTFHSKPLVGEEEMEVKIRDAIGTDIDPSAQRCLLKDMGKDFQKVDGFRIIEVEHETVFAWTVGVANESDHPIKVTLDLSESKNCAFSGNGPTCTKLLQPGRCEAFLNCQAGFGDFEKIINHTAEHLPPPKK